MKRRVRTTPWRKAFERGLRAMTRSVVKAGVRALTPPVASPRPTAAAAQRSRPAAKRPKPSPAGAGTWTSGVAVSAAGARRYRLYRPAGLQRGEALPLMVMLHGCGQDAAGFAAVTRMNRIAARERFLVLYPEQDRLANAQACWNWFDTRSGRAAAEAGLILQAVDQVCRRDAADPVRVALAGLSAGAGMAALLATLHPDRFAAVIMHSGVPPGQADTTLSALRAMRRRGSAAAPAPVPAAPSPRWPPLLVLHGRADPVVSPRNAEVAAQQWAAPVGAKAGAARTVQRGRRHAMQVTDFKQGRRTVATLVLIDRLAHAWSGGAAGLAYSDPGGPDASRLAWAFAARQFKARLA